MSIQPSDKPIQSPLKFRIKAFAIHLAISVTIALISLYIVFGLWHPAPLDKAIGVTHIFLMMLAIDAILGPILTFIVAKPNKKSLKFDLTVIVILQLMAYGYGMYNISVNRPVYIAFDTNRFELVQAGDIPKYSLQEAHAPYTTLGYGSPNWVAVIPPKDGNEQNDRIMEEMGNGIAPSMLPNLYEPLEQQWSKIESEARPLDELNEINEPSQVNATLKQYEMADGWLPMKAFNQDMVVLIDKNANQVVDVVDLRGW